MTAQCIRESLPFQASFRREIVARFDGGAVSSDGGGLVPKPVEQHPGIVRECAACGRLTSPSPPPDAWL